MNSLERVRTVLAGGIPDRVPVCLHNFMLAAREAGVRMEDYRVNPEAIARAHLQAVEKYGHDCILVDTDTTMLAEAMGARSECAPNEPGRIVEPAIRSLDEVDRLKVINPETDGRIPALLEAVRLMSKQVGGEVAIRGNADQAAFDLACMVRGIEDFLMELVEQPDNPRIAQLMEICYQSHLAVHRALAKAGAHFTSMGDSLAGPDVTSPRMFRPLCAALRGAPGEGPCRRRHLRGDSHLRRHQPNPRHAGGIRTLWLRARLQDRRRESQTNRRETPRTCLETSTPAACWHKGRWRRFGKRPGSSSPSGSREADSF